MAEQAVIPGPLNLFDTQLSNAPNTIEMTEESKAILEVPAKVNGPVDEPAESMKEQEVMPGLLDTQMINAPNTNEVVEESKAVLKVPAKVNGPVDEPAESMKEQEVMPGLLDTQMINAPNTNEVVEESKAVLKVPAKVNGPVDEPAESMENQEVMPPGLLDLLETQLSELKEDSKAILEVPAEVNAPVDEPAEWEEDSDPIPSSNSSDSSDSSDSDSDEGDDSFKRLTVAEQAKILMADGGSDDEDGPQSKGGVKEPLQTKNEVAETVLPKPDVIITPDMKVHPLGDVMTIVGGTTATVTIRAGASGDVPRLDAGSVLCLEDKTVIAAIADTFGPVPQPFYIIRFNNEEEVTAAGLSAGTQIFYSEQHAKFVFPSDLRRFKGTDASNMHDEEPNDVEMEFSDDEKEAEYKARRKAHNREKARGGKFPDSGGDRGRGRGRGRGDRSRSGRGGRVNGAPTDNASAILNYDDGDNLYNPLQRPAHFATGADRSESPQEYPYGSRETASVRGGLSRYGGGQRSQQFPYSPRDAQSSSRNYPPSPLSNYNNPQAQQQPYPAFPSQTEHSPQNVHWPQFGSQQPNMPPVMPPPFMMPGFPNMTLPPPPPLPPGGFINPNFFPNQQAQQYQSGQQYPGPQQPGQQGQHSQQYQQYQQNQQNQR